MRALPHYRIWLLTVLLITGLIPGATASANALIPSSHKQSGTTGYTDKGGLRQEGRFIGQHRSLSVHDQNDHEPLGTAYYVDSIHGNDTNDGKSPARPWKTLSKPNQITFHPGDEILLRAGSTWSAHGSSTAKEAYSFTAWNGNRPTDTHGEAGAMPSALLAPKGSGSSDRPIILSSYGEGVAPKLLGMGVVNDTIQLTDQQYWEISNLDISNQKDGFDSMHFSAQSGSGQVPGTENPDTGDLRALHIQAASTGVQSGYLIHDLFIHDVAGVTWSVSKAGVDRSKRTGGIVFEGLKGDSRIASRFKDIQIYDNYIIDTAFANIVFKQFSGMGTARYQDKKPGWGDRAMASVDTQGTLQEDPDWSPHTKIIIRGNYLSNKNTQYGWDAIYLTSVQGSTIEDNLIDGAGVSGIELYWTDNIRVTNNEIGDLERRTGAADSNGIDADRGTSNILFEQNYIHDSGEGFLLCGFSFSSALVRYNLVRNVDRNYINPHGDSGVNVIYNNLLYNSQSPGPANTDGKVHFFASSGDTSRICTDRNLHYLFNNVFINTKTGTNGVLFQDGPGGVTFSDNAYYGEDLPSPPSDASAVTGNPHLKGDPAVDIGNIAIGSIDSPLIAAGLPVNLATLAPGFKITGADVTDRTTASVDFSGKTLNTRPDIGPGSYSPQPGDGVLAGSVLDRAGRPVPQARLSNAPVEIVADSNGHYAVELPAGTYELNAEQDGYDPGNIVTVQVANGQTVILDLSLGQVRTTKGALSGTVFSMGTGVPGADVAVKNRNGDTLADGTTDRNGTYRINKIPAGKGYKVDAGKSGYQTATQTGISIEAARTTHLNLDLKKIQTYEPIIDENFNREPLGGFVETRDGALTSQKLNSIGSTSIESDPENPSNRYLKLDKTSSRKGTLAVFNKRPLGLKGTVTMEARVKRTTANPSPNQAAIYSYNALEWNTTDPAASSNPSATFGFSGSNIITHATVGSSQTTAVCPYVVGKWYQIKNVANLDTGTFSLYVDDMNNPVVRDQPLRTTPADGTLDYFNLFINGSNRGDWLVDYLRIGKGEPAHTNVVTLDAVRIRTANESLSLPIQADSSSVAATLKNPFTRKVTLSITPTDPLAQVCINGEPVGMERDVELVATAPDQDAAIRTTIPVTVTAQDGTEHRYHIDITRTNPSQTTYLQGLSLDGLSFKDDFAYDGQGDDHPYIPRQVLTDAVKNVTVEWVRGWNGQSITVNGIPVAGNTITVPLLSGLTTITVVTDSFTGETGKYVIEVTRSKDHTNTGSGDIGTVMGTSDSIDKITTWTVTRQSLLSFKTARRSVHQH